MSQPVSPARILITNDDGINAPGLAVLEEIAHQLSDDVWVVAPESEKSGAGHSLTLTTPIRVRRLDARRFAVQGTPTDCITMAVNHIMAEARPTLVLSGVNRGANLAEDVTYSGTIAGAMEGTLAGIPSVALSQTLRRPARTPWDTARTHAPGLLRDLLATGWPDSVFININFPAIDPDEVKGIRVTEQGRRDIGGMDIEERKDPRGFTYFWFGLARTVDRPGHESDLHYVREGWISVTPLHMDLTHHDTRRILNDRLERPFK
ncbi:5'/3'-nucleotidase SurE [Rhodothalassium salexigens]|uniref:5'/3'-nucleotidase SurE n=1 Tax=Rhodothalassium salexigens TaxID=1086 RepID=UPI0019144812|nr:5'/3'-nucleotidase SurE [Rhodothalassium salexigens]MBK5920446.1 5'/3'-nucleotidase SurE [Rhodothalassium salexigens]